MGKEDILKIASYLKRSKYRRVWRKIVQTMACLVVFVTTYALILPAITIEQQAFCGLEAHRHTESCYAEVTEMQLICQLPEVEEHIHSDGCYSLVGHAHAESCYNQEAALICEIEETPVEQVLSCTVPELRCHIHAEGCLDESGAAVCGMEEIISHRHDEACYAELTLQQLECTLEEHSHDQRCYADTAADLETPEMWEGSFSGVTLCENWAEDVKAIAATQIGYTESALNFISEDGVTKEGYTRYGAWFNAPYAKWDAMFASFCLNYAEVPKTVVPHASNTAQWFAQVQQMGLVKTLESSTPAVGDVVFFRLNDTAHAGIIYAVDGGEIVAQVRVIAGDIADSVSELNVPAADVMGWIDLAAAQQKHESEAPENGEEISEAEGEEGTTETENGEEAAAEIVVQTAETENYIVTVSYGSDLEMPEGTELRVVEYPKDSDIYRQRCEEAGYELEWLLNIGFFCEGTELDLDGKFDVIVTAKQGGAMGTDVTHFADDGIEHISGSSPAGDHAAVGFATDSFSDYGGGARAAQSATLQLNMIGWGSTLPFSGGNTVNCNIGDTVILKIGDSQCNYNPLNFNYSGCQLVSAANSCDAGHHHTNGYWCTNNLVHTLTILVTSRTASISGDAGWYFEYNSYQVVPNSSGGGGTVTPTPTPTPTPAPTLRPGTVPSYPYHPHAVHTGSVHISRLRFYNLCENTSGGVTALDGCQFLIEGPDGYSHTVYSSGGLIEVNLPTDIPDGTYTITEVSVPAGYVRDTNYQRTFQISGGMLASDKNIGTFINHNIGNVNTSKTAEVEDYNNRIYQVLLEAEAYMRLYEMDPVDVFFVVDQSNSMLFPATLQSTGKYITINANGSGNGWRMDQLGLDKTQMYYIISDPNGTSTVWALWWNGHGWIYQDASYYAKAKHNNEAGYQTPGEIAIFPENRSYEDQKNNDGSGRRSNGGGLDFSIGGGLYNHLNARGGSDTFQIYTSPSEYNRLHYVEESLANMIYELADANANNSVTLVRFTKEVVASDCMGPLRLTPANADTLVSAVSSIKTSGGTRQDLALQYTYENYLRPLGAGSLRYVGEGATVPYKGADRTYTILVSDGAPVLSSGSAIGTLGTDTSPENSDTVYGNVRVQARKVRSGEWGSAFKGSTLMTVALGMGEVKAGSNLLQQIASNTNSFCALDDAAQLVKEMQNLIFQGFRPKEEVPVFGSVYDEISESFYPIAWVPAGQGAGTGHRVLLSDASRDWILLQAGDWITIDGRYTASGASDAYGQLGRKGDGTFYIQWKEAELSAPWNGTVYVKAREDFIGGNAISTNKDAKVTVHGSDKHLETPTVNVRLLDMNEHSSEVTVYLGDLVNASGNSPVDALRGHYDDTTIFKLLSDGGNVMNHYTAVGTDGLENALFYLRYAMGRDLTEQEWSAMINGSAVTIEYTYDYASSMGAVGYFTFRLEKDGIEGANPNYLSHTADAACQPNGLPATEDCDAPAETYTLHISYTAYGLGAGGRPAGNVHNGAGSPGTEVGKGATLPTGLGTVAKENVHDVHVISGSIEITKRFEDGYTTDSDQTFSFTLRRTEDGDDDPGITQTITIPAGSHEGAATILFDDLKRGHYRITEAADAEYRLVDIEVLDTTNVYSEPAIGEADKTVSFVMGNNIANENVIGKASEDDTYTSYIDPVNGVYGAAVFTNEEIVYEGQVHVSKTWTDSASTHGGDAVYIVLLEDGLPVTNGKGQVKILRLDAYNNWTGSFTVALDSETDTVHNHNYSVREAYAVSFTEKQYWQQAILENDGVSVLYYEKTVEEGGLVGINGKGYSAHYTVDANGAWTVTNIRGVELPQTGGIGTHLYYFSGLLMMMTALIYGFVLRRKRERGRVD